MISGFFLKNDYSRNVFGRVKSKMICHKKVCIMHIRFFGRKFEYPAGKLAY